MRIDNLHAWDHGEKLQNCINDLQARKTEERKSCWSHVSLAINDQARIKLYKSMSTYATIGKISILKPIARKIFCWRRPEATLELQALNLYLLNESKHSSEPPSLVVDVLHLDASLVSELIVNELPGDHVVEHYNGSHRELKTKDPRVCSAAVAKIRKAKAQRLPRRHSVMELKPLLQKLLHAGMISDEYVATARKVLDFDPA